MIYAEYWISLLGWKWKYKRCIENPVNQEDQTWIKKIKSTKKFVQVIRFLQPNMSAVSYITFTSIKAGSSTIIESLDWAQVAHF